ncbi:MAG TPA: GNAT family protein [Methylomirabilota bacterium]|nr:GNAT family protein [Methylomirabilota bacterium]
MDTEQVVEIRVPEELTHRTAWLAARLIWEQLALAPPHLWLNVESVKAVDVVGLAVIAQATARASAAGTTTTIFPSAIVYNALFASGLLDRLPVDKRRAGERPEPDRVLEVEAPRTVDFVAQTPRLGLRPPTWDELRLLQGWAHDVALDELVGSQLLAMCRHLGPYHPEFVSEAMASPIALTLLIQPRHTDAEPVGFVRLYNINLDQRFLFLETLVAQPRGRRIAWGIEATRLACAYAVEALGIERVETKVYAYNTLSVNSLKRNGFTLEGTLRQARMHGGRRWDILVFSALEPEIRDELAADNFAPMGFWNTPAAALTESAEPLAAPQTLARASA